MNGYAPSPVSVPAQDASQVQAQSTFEPQFQPETESGTSGYAYEPPTSSYDPSTSYSPYVPDEPSQTLTAAGDDVEGEEKPKSKKKGFMDDDEEDDDLAARAAALKSKQKSEADRVADEAFRKAAEADGVYFPSFSLPFSPSHIHETQD